MSKNLNFSIFVKSRFGYTYITLKIIQMNILLSSLDLDLVAYLNGRSSVSAAAALAERGGGFGGGRGSSGGRDVGSSGGYGGSGRRDDRGYNDRHGYGGGGQRDDRRDRQGKYLLHTTSIYFSLIQLIIWNTN